VREPGNVIRGYSARRNSSAVITVVNPTIVRVEDDVALVVDSASPDTAWAYSAVTNTWSSVVMTTPIQPFNVATSRFVIGIQDGLFLHGFSARRAVWDSIVFTDPPGLPLADGNVVLVDLVGPTGVGATRMAAFSGVRGIWALSPLFSPLPPIFGLDHNVAYVETMIAGLTHYAAYTAYDAAWITSTVGHPPGSATATIRDNLVLVEDSIQSQRYEAFGARPALWATLAGDFKAIMVDEDYAIVERATQVDMYGFSGVCGATWVPALTGTPAFPLGSPDHMGALIEGTRLHVFEPAMNTWGPVTTPPASAVVTVEDTVIDVRDLAFEACAGRWGGWVTGAAVPAQPFAIASGGSLVAHQQTAGVGAGDIYVFDERCDMWPTAPFNPGVVSPMTAGRNQLLVHPAAGGNGPVFGYSVQRGDWTTPGPITTPLAVQPVPEENVAWLVDASNQLWAFGSPNKGHVYYAWPNGTEYHISGNILGTALVPRFGYSILGVPFTTGSFGIISTGVFCPGFPLTGFLGFVCIDLTWFSNLGFFGITDADCLREKLVNVPNPVGNCLQLWLQPLTYDFGLLTWTWEHRCDPAWFF
jgi:hypothetical protein